MDPQAAADAMLCAFQRGQYRDAFEHFVTLGNWIGNGGFPPKRFDKRHVAAAMKLSAMYENGDFIEESEME